uniref:(northern house mosquito) hypothetical protein n=1 Tax=Culex pipiens TaxID=7175 RepID=A0A8D8NEI1_CULPI
MSKLPISEAFSFGIAPSCCTGNTAFPNSKAGPGDPTFGSDIADSCFNPSATTAVRSSVSFNSPPAFSSSLLGFASSALTVSSPWRSCFSSSSRMLELASRCRAWSP